MSGSDLTDLDQGLANAFAQLQSSLVAYVNQKLGEKALAEDLVQMVFEKAIRNQAKGQKINNVRAWLFAITRTTVADYYRGNRIDFSPLESVDEVWLTIEDDEDFLPSHELSNCLMPFIAQLPPALRESLEHVDISGQPLKLLAEEQGVSVSAIKSRASRARKKLKVLIEQCCKVHLQNGVVEDWEMIESKNKDTCCK